MHTEPGEMKSREWYDEQPIAILMGLALTSTDAENDPGWEAIWALRRRGTRDVFDAAVYACESDDANERRVGAAILYLMRDGGFPFQDSAVPILIDLLEEDSDAGVIASAASVLGHYGDSRGIFSLVKLKNHPNVDVRFAVAFALGFHEDERALNVLIELSSDQDEDVRDWATFGLTNSSADSDVIRSALYARIMDPHEHGGAYGEGIEGLAKRKDPRAIEPILAYLESGQAGTQIFDAAAELADPCLYAALLKVKNEQADDYASYELEALDAAIAACQSERLA